MKMGMKGKEILVSILFVILFSSSIIIASPPAFAFTEITKRNASEPNSGAIYGRSVSIDDDTIVVGAPFAHILFNTPAFTTFVGAAYVLGKNVGGADNWGEIKKLTDTDPLRNNRFGESVSISGDIIVVGSPGDDLGAGSAFVYGRNVGGADNWGEIKKIIASDGESFNFGTSVAISGDTIVVGSNFGKAGGISTGTAYVYGKNVGGTDNWGEIKKISASDGAFRDSFGTSVAIFDDTIIVGSNGDDTIAGFFTGSAYVFGRNVGGADNWGEIKKIIASDAATNDNYGVSVSIFDDTIVVGADKNVGLFFLPPGTTYVYGRNVGGADNWGEIKKIIDPNPVAGFVDGFGESVSVYGDTIVVGGREQNSDIFRTGAAYTFGKNIGGPDNWGLITQISASDRTTNDFFGNAVSIFDDTTVIGAFGERGIFNFAFAGAVYVFTNLPPAISATLQPIDIQSNKGLFQVQFSVTDDTDTNPTILADINGIPVTNAQLVNLEPGDVLTVIATDESNHSTTVNVAPSFSDIPPATIELIGEVNLNLKIGLGQTLTLNPATVNGNLEVEGGTIIFKPGSGINGNVICKDGSNLTIQSSTINGNILIDGCDSVIIFSVAPINGNIDVKNSNTVIILNNSIMGNLDVKENLSVTVTGNNISGSLKVIDNTNCVEGSNTVSGTTEVDGCSFSGPF